MKVAVYTLTRDRLEYTERSFASLRANAGYPYTHYVIDNGSTDGTPDWLWGYAFDYPWVVAVKTLPENIGISKASNMILDRIPESYDLVIKMDNDCEVVTQDILKSIVEVYTELGDLGAVLSPRVEGINRQPSREFESTHAGYRVGRTGIVGGLFHVLQAPYYRAYRYPENLPKAWGQDDNFCSYAHSKDYIIGYLEDLVVNHIDGTTQQAVKFPDYFTRKWQEEKEA